MERKGDGSGSQIAGIIWKKKNKSPFGYYWIMVDENDGQLIIA